MKPSEVHPAGNVWGQPGSWRYAILFEDQWDRQAAAFDVLAAQAEAHTLAYLRGQGEVQEGSLLSLMQE